MYIGRPDLTKFQNSVPTLRETSYPVHLVVVFRIIFIYLRFFGEIEAKARVMNDTPEARHSVHLLHDVIDIFLLSPILGLDKHLLRGRDVPFPGSQKSVGERRKVKIVVTRSNERTVT